MGSCEASILLPIIIVTSLLANIGLIVGIIQCHVSPCTIVRGENVESIERSDNNYGLVVLADEGQEQCDCTHHDAPFKILEICVVIALAGFFSYCCYKGTIGIIAQRRIKKVKKEEKIRKKVTDELCNKE